MIRIIDTESGESVTIATEESRTIDLASIDLNYAARYILPAFRWLLFQREQWLEKRNGKIKN